MNTPTELQGIHHVTAITSSAEKIYEFFTNVLGLRLVKKTVNQDDIQTYHLFFADDRGNPGTDITFFDFRNISKHQKGTNDISRTSFRVPNDKALEYWLKRFDVYNVKHDNIQEMFNTKVINFEDFDGQRYALFSDENDNGVLPGEPWYKGKVPNEFAINALGPIFLSVDDLNYMEIVLTSALQMRKISTEGNYTLYEMGLGGNGGRVIVEHLPSLSPSIQGYGGVHHVAFRVKDKEALDKWINYFNDLNLPNSGFVDRFYFKSLYVRLYPNILFEIATDGPGFIDDVESYDILGETLALPPHLRHKQEYIEGKVRHFDTVRSDKTFEKEYLD